ncbi:MAG: hypothetical protein MUC50_18970 [Myxococcota bacterium]|jgi:Tol biopolymer transport system component|nr:hypothetical protein [Myxococcota bacterium]
MKKLTASADGIFDFAWSSDSSWLAYSEGGNAYILNAKSGEIRTVGKGECPGITKSLSIVIERDNQIWLITGNQERVLVSSSDLVKDAPKRIPTVSHDGEWVLFVVSHVYDKRSESQNAYPHRHFYGLVQAEGGKPRMIGEQFYGGGAVFFPDGKYFAHYEYDSTGGPQIHVVDLDGKKRVSLPGLHPSISPDGKQIAGWPKGGGALVLHSTRGEWTKSEVETRILSLPSSGQRRTAANPPIWLDNRLLLVDDSENSLLRIDTKKDKPEDFKKAPVPSARRRPTMVISPSREWLALEVEIESGFELRLVSLL